MADFNIAVALTLKNEGGFVDNPADPGGATNMGVEQRDVPGIPIQDLTSAEATSYYQQNYWKTLYSQIDSQDVANKIFDMGVLFGVGEAIQVLQRTLILPADGIFGPVTLSALNQADAAFLGRYKDKMYQRAQAIAFQNPKEGIFLIGWQRRIQS